MALTVVLGSGMSMFVMMDLEFGPMLLLSCLGAVAVALLLGFRSRIMDTAATTGASSSPLVVSFASSPTPHDVTFNATARGSEQARRTNLEQTRLESNPMCIKVVDFVVMK